MWQRGLLMALALGAGGEAAAQFLTLPPSALPDSATDSATETTPATTPEAAPPAPGAAPALPPAPDPAELRPDLPLRTLADPAAPAAPGPAELPLPPLQTLPDAAAAAPAAPPAPMVGPPGLPLPTLPQAQPQQAARPQPQAPVRLPSTAPAGVSRFSPAITVNNGAVTWYDIDQRMALLGALGARGDLRQLAVDQLTEDAVKIQAAKALQIELPEGAVMTGIEEFAAQRGLAVDDVYQVLAARGIDNQAMEDFVEAGLLWREVVQSRFRAKSLPSESDLDIALATAANAPVEIVQLSEIALPFGERGEQETIELAERLSRQLGGGASFAAAARQYSRSDSAASGGRMEPMPAAQLPPAIRSQVLLLGPGGVTRPIPISGGLAILRVDSVRMEPPSAASAEIPDEEIRNQMREQIFQQRINTFGQGYLQELLRDALIVER